jgi:hypothetical protein
MLDELEHMLFHATMIVVRWLVQLAWGYSNRCWHT